MDLRLQAWRPGLLSLMALLGLAGASSAAAEVNDRYLVREGDAQSAVIVDGPSEGITQRAVDEFIEHVERASGVRLPIIDREQIDQLPESHAIVVIGSGPLAQSLGFSADALDVEAYRVKTDGRYLIFQGHDITAEQAKRKAFGGAVDDSPATMWAVNHFLDHELGVRWVWPGELGTYVPETATIPVPELDVEGRPELQQRKMRIHMRARDLGGRRFLSDEDAERLLAEAKHWKSRHQMGRRASYRFGHAFGDWWEKYHADHPELFATPLEGETQPEPRPDRVKLCVSNPAVDEMIIREWKEAGTPDNWPIAPNDATRFCVCDDCRALDVPPNQAKEDIWFGAADLTGRYTKFWSRLLSKMREINPDVTLSAYAYGAYREPLPDMQLEGMVLGFVHTWKAFEEWRGWSDAGAQLILRPNWLSGTGGPAPHLILHEIGEYFQFAQSNNMIGFDIDTQSVWAMEGPMYYLIARLSSRPDLTIDQIIGEWASAFGPAAPVVREYIDYWERFSQYAGYAANAGGVISMAENSPYERLLREQGFPIHPSEGSWRVLPLLYTDDVLQDAASILDRAESRLGSEDEVYRRRVQFLRDGLRHLEMTRDVVELGDEQLRPADKTEADFHQLAERLQELRHELSLRHVVWGETMNDVEARRGNIKTRSGRDEAEPDDGDLEGR